jgi:hypothetical protein
MKTNRTLKLTTAIIESVLAIPIIGGLLIIMSLWSILLIMLALHIITLVYSSREKKSKYGSILGIVTSAIGWIPAVGWMMHVATAVCLWVSFARD